MLAAEPDIELMLLDINMPVMDGLTLLNELARAAIAGAGDHRLGLWRHDQSAHRDEPRRLRFRHQAGRSERSRDHRPQDARRHRQAARDGPAARGRRAGAQQSFALFLAEHRRDAGRLRTSRWARCGGETVAVLFADIVGFTRMAEHMPPEEVVAMLREFHDANDGADLRLRRHRREIYRRRDLRRVRRADCRAPTMPPTRCNCAEMMLAALDDWNERARSGRASRRSRSASASITARLCLAMSAASTACRSR